MYNGIGLTTPRGSGTSGYVQRNLSALRVHEKNNDKSTWDLAPPKYREPDEGILEHERKRKVEVKCLELQVELEEKEVDEAEIERRVDELRQKLLANLAVEAKSGRASFKPSDTHAIAAAKKTELAKMARALGTRPDYQEGDAFDKEKQEEARQRRILEKEEREKERAERAKKQDEGRKRLEEQKKKWQEERQKNLEEERERRREMEEKPRREDRPMPPPSVPRRDYRDRDRESSRRSPPPLTRGGRQRPIMRDILPPIAPMRKRERDSPSRSRSRSPRTRRRVHSRSRSASRSASTDSVGRGRVRRRSPSRSPPPHHRTREGGLSSRSPARWARGSDNDRARDRDKVELPSKRSSSPIRDIRRGGRAPSRSLSRSPSRSLSPPLKGARRGRYDSPSRSRSRSPPPRVQARLGRFEGRYASPPPPRGERAEQKPPYLPTPTGRRSRSASTGSSMSVSSRSASGSRSD